MHPIVLVLLSIVLSVLLRFTDSGYLPLVSCGHCVVCPSSIYGFWLPPFGILWPLCCLSFFYLRILVTSLWYLVAIVLSVLLLFTDSGYLPLVSCGHCVVCPSSIYGFWLPPFGILWPLCCLSFFYLRILVTSLWYLVAIVLSVLLLFTDSGYPFGILWPLCCLSFFYLRILVTPLVSCGHCVVCPSSIYGFWLPLWYLVAIVLSVLLLFTDSGYPFGILWPLCCLSFFYLRILVTPLVSCGHCVVCPSSIYGFWLPLWYLVAIVLSVLLRFTDSGYPFGILWPLCCLSFFYLRILVTPLVSCGHCVVCPSSIYGFWLPLWYLVAIVLSVLLLFTDSGYPFGILWPLCCLSFFYLRILVTPLVSCGHCVVCPSSIYGFWLPL